MGKLGRADSGEVCDRERKLPRKKRVQRERYERRSILFFVRYDIVRVDMGILKGEDTLTLGCVWCANSYNLRRSPVDRLNCLK